MILLIVLSYGGIAASFILLFEFLKVLGEHKEAIEKNKSAIQLLANRFDEEGENNEQ